MPPFLIPYQEADQSVLLQNCVSLSTILCSLCVSDGELTDSQIFSGRPPVGRLLHYTSLCYASASAILPHSDVTVLHRYNPTKSSHSLVKEVQLLLLEEQFSSQLRTALGEHYCISPDTEVCLCFANWVSSYWQASDPTALVILWVS